MWANDVTFSYLAQGLMIEGIDLGFATDLPFDSNRTVILTATAVPNQTRANFLYQHIDPRYLYIAFQFFLHTCAKIVGHAYGHTQEWLRFSAFRNLILFFSTLSVCFGGVLATGDDDVRRRLLLAF